MSLSTKWPTPITYSKQSWGMLETCPQLVSTVPTSDENGVLITPSEYTEKIKDGAVFMVTAYLKL